MQEGAKATLPESLTAGRQSLTGSGRRGQEPGISSSGGSAQGRRCPAEPCSPAAVQVLEQHHRDGVITNDKFCWVRRTRLQLSWSRLAVRSRSGLGSTVAATSLLPGGIDATTPVDCTPNHAAGPGRATPVGPSLSGPADLVQRCIRRQGTRRRGSGPSFGGGS
jgi:hypothetical protein